MSNQDILQLWKNCIDLVL